MQEFLSQYVKLSTSGQGNNIQPRGGRVTPLLHLHNDLEQLRYFLRRRCQRLHIPHRD